MKENGILSSSEAITYTGVVARLNLLGKDRSEIQHASEELGNQMSTPTLSSKTTVKRLLQTLKGVPRVVPSYGYQPRPEAIVARADGDFAVCEKSRESTSAGVVMLGNRLLKSWSANQDETALSSGEPEYYGPVHTSSVS